jgi:hypothetical protein
MGSPCGGVKEAEEEEKSDSLHRPPEVLRREPGGTESRCLSEEGMDGERGSRRCRVGYFFCAQSGSHAHASRWPGT